MGGSSCTIGSFNLPILQTTNTTPVCVDKKPVEISYKDLEEIFHLSTTGDKLHNIVSDPVYNWSQANHFLRNTPAPFHVGVTSSLGKDARTIQHVLRSSIIPKAGDRIHITPLLSLTTFYIMARREFNASDLLIRDIENLTTIRNPGYHRKPNIALGHIISYVLTTKYNFEFPSTSTSPPIPPTFFINNSFHILHSTHLHPDQREVGEEEEEAQPEQVPDPVPTTAPLRQHSQIDQLVERFDAFETRFDTFEAQQQQFQSRVYEYMDQQQQHTQDRTWFVEQFDLFFRFHPPPPPPPPEDDDLFTF
ncbi:hypothetical protein M5K25_001465 [Dendrobium thyrsiflorum]|uniref:Uncharacterized protein n=1 Tax=Dendrobium thyrsiflorum TaxID=117978 RepID=A0ABD0VRW7_DENTH